MSGQWWVIRALALEGLSPGRRVWFHTVRWLPLVAAALFTTLVFPATGSLDVPVWAEGAVAEATVVAPVGVEFWERTERVADPAARRLQLVPDSVRHVVRSGATVVVRGEVVTRGAALALQALRDRLAGRTPPQQLLRATVGPVLLNGAILALFWFLLLFYRWESYASLRQMAFFGLLFAAVAGLAALSDRVLPGRPEFLPVPFLAILVTLLYNGRVGLFASAAAAVLLGSQWALQGEHVLVFALFGGTAAALATRVARRRRELYMTILAVIVAYAVAALALGLVHGWAGSQIGWSVARGTLTAVGSASLAMFILPAAEWATRITTDVTLLELSDSGHPLLRRLALEAPGTFAHSMAMANLSEAACSAIGAHGLLARVGCLYHDVGKVLHPGFFVENQRPGENPHDAIPPAESAAIVRAHVTDGIRLAEEAHLPESIKAFIPEHHGTQLIEYFYDRARRGGAAVNEEDYRYPGPRPRTLETAVVMMADATEAALRMLGDPTPERVRGAVDFLIKQKVDAGQLRNCPITLNDLDRVKEEFVRVIGGMHHQRIEYPASAGGVNAALVRTRA